MRPRARRHYRIVNGRPLTAQEEEALGLDRLGVNCRRGWLEAEEREFAKGMQRCVHDSLEFICEKVLPKKGMLKLAEYYYNVWKTRSTVDAIRFYCLAEVRHGPCRFFPSPTCGLLPKAVGFSKGIAKVVLKGKKDGRRARGTHAL